MSTLVFPKWLRDKSDPMHYRVYEPTVVGTSGGKTSGLLAFLVDQHNRAATHPIVYSFQNTGREHERTYEFLRNLNGCLSRSVHWLEYRKPEIVGSPPKDSRVEVVDFDKADRKGKPFADLLQALADYRRVEKGLGPIGPNPVQRLCTSYLKIKTQHRYVRALGWSEYTAMVGLRADEPKRVARLGAKDTSEISTEAPLAHDGITNEDVKRFWSEQPFTLEIPENLGNCTLCFLKDEADLAFNMLHESDSEEVAWWLGLQDIYGQWNSNSGPTYRQILEEAPLRLDVIRPAVANKTEPECPAGFNPKRFRQLIKQEERVLREGIVRVPCSCEVAENISDESLL